MKFRLLQQSADPCTYPTYLCEQSVPDGRIF